MGVTHQVQCRELCVYEICADEERIEYLCCMCLHNCHGPAGASCSCAATKKFNKKGFLDNFGSHWTLRGCIAFCNVHCISFEKFMRRKLNFKTKYRRTVEINKHEVLTSLIPFGTIFIVPMLSRNREAIQNMLFSFIVLAMAILSKTKAVCLLLYHH